MLCVFTDVRRQDKGGNWVVGVLKEQVWLFMSVVVVCPHWSVMGVVTATASLVGVV